MALEFLGALASIAKDAIENKVGDVKGEYEKEYDKISRMAENWDDQRLRDEYRRVYNSGNMVRKMAMTKILQERGLTNH